MGKFASWMGSNMGLIISLLFLLPFLFHRFIASVSSSVSSSSISPFSPLRCFAFSYSFSSCCQTSVLLQSSSPFSHFFPLPFYSNSPSPSCDNPLISPLLFFFFSFFVFLSLFLFLFIFFFLFSFFLLSFFFLFLLSLFSSQWPCYLGVTWSFFHLDSDID